MALIVKGEFPVIYRPSGVAAYTLTDPSIVALRGELSDDCMGAFAVTTEVDGVHYVVTDVANDGTLTAHHMFNTSEVIEIPEVGTVIETPFGIYADDEGVLRG